MHYYLAGEAHLLSNTGNKSKPQKCALWFSKAVILLTLILTVIALIGSVIAINRKADPFTIGNSTFSKLYIIPVTIAGAAGLIILWRYLFRLTANMSEKTLHILCEGLFTFFCAICAVMCIFMKVTPTNDSKHIQDMAQYMMENNTYHIDTGKGYFQNYSNNDLLTILISVFFRVITKLGVSNLSQACIYLNGICIIAAEIFAFFGVKILFGLKTACRYLIISVMQPVMYLTVVWSYSNTMCLPFMCGLFLLGAFVYKSRKSAAKCIFGALFGTVAVIGYYIRPVVMFEAIAFAMFAVLCLICKKHNAKQVIACMLVTVAVGGAVFAGTSTFINEYGGDNSRNFPLTHWLMMGLHKYGRFSSEDSSFTRSYPTKEEKKNANIAEIKKSLKEIGIAGMPAHVIAKHCITWSEGSANYYLRAKNVEEENLITGIMVGGGRSYIMLYCQMFRAAVLFLAAAAMLAQFRLKRIDRSFFPLLTLFGGMVFYIFWEAKESYSIPFLFILVLLAALGAGHISELKFRKKAVLPSDAEINVQTEKTVHE